ncbi:MAG: DUF6452 family protein [Aquaticitalea sp.]
MKQKTTYTILLLALIIFATWSCERDDLCAEATLTTPHLIIRFYDVSEPDELKSVRQLTLRALADDGSNLEEITATSADSIVLPLRTSNPDGSITTRFSLEKDSDYFDNGDDTTDSNSDVIAVTYTPELEYVSRACGYKNIYTNLSVTIETDTDNWIRTRELITTTIENENQAHVILRH